MLVSALLPAGTMPAVVRTLRTGLMGAASVGYEELMNDGIHSAGPVPRTVRIHSRRIARSIATA
ncbi:hypothetical protein GCM10025773_07180 [Microbacterium jejuense]